MSKDRIHRNVINDSVRDKMLDGEYNREDCDEDNLHRFLCLLKEEQ